MDLRWKSTLRRQAALVFPFAVKLHATGPATNGTALWERDSAGDLSSGGEEDRTLMRL